MLTIFFVFIFSIRVSYIFTKYSDFWKIKIFSDFQKMRYTKYMIEIFAVYVLMALAFAYTEIKQDLLNKKIASGYNPNAKDGDKDGIVQEGTKWERSI